MSVYLLSSAWIDCVSAPTGKETAIQVEKPMSCYCYYFSVTWAYVLLQPSLKRFVWPNSGVKSYKCFTAEGNSRDQRKDPLAGGLHRKCTAVKQRMMLIVSFSPVKFNYNCASYTEISWQKRLFFLSTFKVKLEFFQCNGEINKQELKFKITIHSQNSTKTNN